MNTLYVTSTIRPVVSEAAARAAGRGLSRAVQGLGLLAELLTELWSGTGRQWRQARELMERRRQAQQVLDMARRYERSQPGFASDLHAAAWRALGD